MNLIELTGIFRYRLPLYKDLETKRWVAVLRIAHMWGFDNVRDKSIKTLEKDKEFSQNTMERLELAHKFAIPSGSNWRIRS